MTTERLHEFHVLATVLNYSRAAEQLFITQSVLSRHIMEMERGLGATLFTRSTHGVELTDEGQYLLREVVPILRKSAHTETLLASNITQSEGEVSLVAQEQTMCTPVLTFVQSFSAKYPDIRLNLHLIDSAADIGAISGADILLTPCDLSAQLPSEIAHTHLFSQEALIAFPPYHHFGDLQEVELEQLGGETLIIPFAGELMGPYARNAFLAARKCKGRLYRMEAATPTEGLLMVELGQGIMIIPHHFKHRVYPHTRTVRIADEECTFPIYAYLNEGMDNKAARLFFESLTAEMRA